MIEDFINKAIAWKTERRKDQPVFLQPYFSPKTAIIDGVPTLKKGFYRETSPLLSKRFEMFGRWTMATHGHWLSIPDMETLWDDDIRDDLLNQTKSNQIAAEDNWANEASCLFKPERLSLFAGSDIGNEKIYLLWLDFVDEPEFWVYDSNGESRYRNLQTYLEAFLAGDISASQSFWRA